MAIDEVQARSVEDQQRELKLRKERKRTYGIGLLKGLAVTLRHLFKHNTVIEYPDVKQDLPARTRGVIALKEENCTVCMLCARECPDWCIYIDSHKETLPPKRAGGRPRKRNVLDRFAIDYALCMYCGICVEVCPYDALFWSREYEYAEYDIRQLTHEKERLSDWMATVLPPPPLEEGALLPGQPEPPAPERATGNGTAEMKPATAARPATQSSSAVEARPEQAADAPKAPTAAPVAAGDEKEQAPAPQATSETQVEEQQPEAEANAAEPEPAPNVEVTGASTSPPKLVPTEDPDEVYRTVLQEQLDAGSSPQVAEARAKVARLKAERGVSRGPTPIETDKRVPSAPVKGHFTEPVPSGAPDAEPPQPESGPVAPTDEEEGGKS